MAEDIIPGDKRAWSFSNYLGYQIQWTEGNEFADIATDDSQATRVDLVRIWPTISAGDLPDILKEWQAARRGYLERDSR